MWNSWKLKFLNWLRYPQIEEKPLVDNLRSSHIAVKSQNWQEGHLNKLSFLLRFLFSIIYLKILQIEIADVAVFYCICNYHSFSPLSVTTTATVVCLQLTSLPASSSLLVVLLRVKRFS